MRSKAKKIFVGGSIAVTMLAMIALIGANAALAEQAPSEAYIADMVAEAHQMGYDAGAKGPLPQGEQDFLKENGDGHFQIDKPYKVHDPDYPELTDRLNAAYWDGYFPDAAGFTFEPNCADRVCNIGIRWQK
jgi:hypothetical protein